MQFTVIGNRSSIPDSARNAAFLWTDNWNDYWEYQTLYVLTYVDEDGERHRIGEVKIGEFDWVEDQGRPNIPKSFETLRDDFFSLGQSAEYYELLRGFGADFCNTILTALNDIALDNALFLRASDESVMGISIMRSVNERTVSGQYRRIINGGAKLTAFDFSYRGPQQLDPEFDPVELAFSVQPGSRPPTNIQVLIGRNGVGKSFLMNSMSRALVNPKSEPDDDGEFFEPDDILDEGFENPFANILSVTFSAFDDFPIIQENQNALKGIRYTNIGLRALEWSTERVERWRRALNTLETDPIFEDADVGQLIRITQKREFNRAAKRLFKKLSSGHKIVLLTITKLVEKNRNGVAIIATHSPVILQEVPRSCVWKMYRHGGGARVERPERHDDFDDVLAKFDHEIGMEGRALISSLIAIRDAEAND